MDRRTLLSLAASTPLLVAAVPPHAQRKRSDDLSLEILNAALSFDRGGGYDRTWGSSGVPADIEHRGERILSGSKSGTYCCGFTFAVAMKVLEAQGLMKRRSAADIRRFQKQWYGATGDSKERLCAQAVETLGVGREVEVDDARPGDFCQLWRATKKPSGHSVLFLGWIEPVAGERAGFHYLSSQASTDGVGFAAEFFAESDVRGGRVDPERMYFGRLER